MVVQLADVEMASHAAFTDGSSVTLEHFVLSYVAYQVTETTLPNMLAFPVIVIEYSVLVLPLSKVVMIPNIELALNVAGNECVTLTDT